MPLPVSNPSELDEELVQRLLLLVVTSEPRLRVPSLPKRIELVDEDDAGGLLSRPCSKRSRTRAAPTPTNISTNSEPLMEKKGTAASPATALQGASLPVPGGPHEKDALSAPRAPSRP